MYSGHGRLEDLHGVLDGEGIDVFVASASFEERCLSIVRSLGPIKIARAVVGVNRAYREAIGENLQLMEDALDGRGERLYVHSDRPVESAGNIGSTVVQWFAGAPKRVVVDITTFTRETLLMLLDCICRRKREADKVLLAYASASDYSVGNPSNEKWLSKGIRDVRSVLGFPGSMAPSKPVHLLVMVGFEDERALELVRICEPAFVSLGVADIADQGAKPHRATNRSRLERLRRRLEGRVRGVSAFGFRAYDPAATKAALRRQMAEFEGCNAVLVPMNTKISTVGAMLLAQEDERVQICYAPANFYNILRYSTPGSDYYLFEPWAQEFGEEDR